MKQLLVFLAIFTVSSLYAQWNSTINSPAHLSPSVNGNITYSTLQQRFNLPSTDGLGGSFHLRVVTGIIQMG